MSVWLVLLAVTAVTAWLGSGGGRSLPGDRYRGAAIILLAFVKIRFVILDFMEIRHAPVRLRLAFEAGVLIVCAMILAIDLG